MLHEVSDEAFEKGTGMLRTAAKKCSQTEHQRLSGAVKELESRLDEASAAHDTLKEEHATLHGAHQEATTAREGVNTAMSDEMGALSQQMASMSQQIAAKDHELAAVQQHADELLHAQKALVGEKHAMGSQIQGLQEHVQGLAPVAKRCESLEEEARQARVEIGSMRNAMEQYQSGAEEVRKSHRELQARYEQGQTELAAAYQQLEAAETQSFLATVEAKSTAAGADIDQSGVRSDDGELRELQTVCDAMRHTLRSKIVQLKEGTGSDTAELLESSEFDPMESPSKHSPIQLVPHQLVIITIYGRMCYN